jgi:hypothetical protein
MKRQGRVIPETLWKAFSIIAKAQDVSLEDEDDWGPWWDFWIAGFHYALEPKR